MSSIRILCLDGIRPSIGADLQRFVTRCFGQDTELELRALDLTEAEDVVRGQYESTVILRLLLEEHGDRPGRVLGITTRDLFIPMLSFLFGHAQLAGKVALVSTARLAQEFYGLDPDPSLLLQRLHTEVAHELGHTFGMRHCSNDECCMALSTAIEQVDSKRAEFCDGCRSLLRELMTQETSAAHAEGNEEVLS